MAKLEVARASDDKEYRGFMRAILDDVNALERMIESQKIETGIRRIGAEQEIFLVDRNWRPANLAVQMLDALKHPQFTTELAQFNLECNLTPRRLAGRGLYEMEQELNEMLERARKAAREFDARCVLTGILPTLTQSDLGLESMTPIPRYHRLNKVMTDMRGGVFQAVIKGIDELNVKHDNVLFEACNTSFQIHFQSSAEEFPKLYNLAQVITAPVLAAAVNSPVCMQNRLWHESRIALFQQSVDERSDAHQRRGRRPRVSFGDSWVKQSVLEIFREDIARFRLVLTTELGETSTAMLDRGEIPPLTALRLHNGTVYRWNRACYGVIDGKPHLRIEVRALPAGPSVIDEIANAALFFGLMSALIEEHKDITRVMSFDDAKSNFFIAARSGLKATFHWINGQEISASDLILQQLLPRAREGLREQKVNADDIERYLGVVEARVKGGRTGSQWAFDSLASMHTGTRDERYRALVSSTAKNQLTPKPVHEWDLARVGGEGTDWRSSYRTVDQVMTRDVFTVHPEDIVDLAASLMEWEHIRHVPVEDKDGHVVGLVSHRSLMRILASGAMGKNEEPIPVRDIMKTGILTTTADASVLDAIALMRRSKVSCLPVVDKDQKLIGIVTEHDFLEVAARLFEEQLREPLEPVTSSAIDASVTPRFTRQLGGYTSGQPGPTIVFVGGLHGNEPAGVTAIMAVLAELQRTKPALRGRVVGFTGNITALTQDRRYVTHDLNRRWSAAEVAKVKAQDPALDTSEQKEQRELLALLEPLMDGARDFLLVDLHSTSSSGLPFSVCGDTLKNRRAALWLPIPLLLGLEESIEGSLCEFATERGHAAFVVEGGQNRDPATQAHHEAAIWIVLEESGALARDQIPDLAAQARMLKGAGRGAPGVIEVTYRHAIAADSQFVMKPGFKNIHTIGIGEELARDKNGAIRAPHDGVLLMPLYQGLGDDGFFLGASIRRSWLRISAFLRRLGLDGMLTMLPGVRAHETRAHAISVRDGGLARLYPSALFRLFGYRKVRQDAGRTSFVRRRQ